MFFIFIKYFYCPPKSKSSNHQKLKNFGFNSIWKKFKNKKKRYLYKNILNFDARFFYYNKRNMYKYTHTKWIAQLLYYSYIYNFDQIMFCLRAYDFAIVKRLYSIA